MAPPLPFHPQAIINVALSFFLLFNCGALLSLGIFNSAVEKSALSRGALDGVWSSSMALMTMLSALVMFATGISLTNARRPPVPLDDFVDPAVVLNCHTRRLFLFASAAYAFLALAPLGIAWGSPIILSCVVASQAVPLGVIYVIIVELLQSWMPLNPGLVVGCGQMAFAFGTMVFSQIFHFLLRTFSISTVFYITAALLLIPSAVTCTFITWPPPDDDETFGMEDTFLLHEHESSVIPLRKLFTLPVFWCYTSTILASQATFAFYPYFFKLGYAFGNSDEVIVNSFKIILLCSVISHPLIGVIADSLKWGHGRFSIGPKNMMVLFLAMQMVLYLLLIRFSHGGNFGGFVTATCVLYIVLSSGGCGGSLLAREIFGAKNTSLVFGVGAGFGFGFGDFASAELMAIVDSASKSQGATPSRYVPFYMIAILWSFVGMVSCAMMQRYESVPWRTQVCKDGLCACAVCVSRAKKICEFETGYGAIGKPALTVHPEEAEELLPSCSVTKIGSAVRAL